MLSFPIYELCAYVRTDNTAHMSYKSYLNIPKYINKFEIETLILQNLTLMFKHC